MSRDDERVLSIPDLAGAVLVGGKSLRMGADKATLPFGSQSQSLTAHILEQLLQVCGAPVWVVSAPDQPFSNQPWAHRVLHDRIAGCGPLEGLAVAMHAARNFAALAVTACDTPFANPQLIHAMATMLLSGNHDAVAVHDGTIFHPFTAVYRTTIADHVDGLLRKGSRSLHGLLASIRCQSVPLDFVRIFDPQLRVLVNLNSPEDYEAALRATSNGSSASPS